MLFRMLGGDKKMNSNEEFSYILLWGTGMLHQYDPVPMLNDKLNGLLDVAANDLSGYVFSNLQAMRLNGTPYLRESALSGIPCAIQIMLPIAKTQELLKKNSNELYGHIKRIYPLTQEDRFASVDIEFKGNKFEPKEFNANMQRSGSGLNSYNNLTRI